MKTDNRLKQIPCKRHQQTSKIEKCMHSIGVHVNILRNAVDNVLGHSLWNDFTDTTFYGRSLSSFSSVERKCVAIFFLRWPNEHVTSKLLYRWKSTNYQARQ